MKIALLTEFVPNLYRICTEFIPNLPYSISVLDYNIIASCSFSPSSRARIYIMYSLPPPFILPFKFMFYNILINQPFTKLFQKYGEKVIDIFGLNRNMPYFCIRFPRDGKPWNWHSDRNGVGTPTFFFSFALIPTKNTAF